ncbi:MAG: DUF4436 family protein [Renibacterium sp.]|nr:DUF4436 family protein [Renibacterium sp.]
MAQDTSEAESPSAGAGSKARSRLHPTALLIALAIVALYVLSLVLQANSGATRNTTEAPSVSQGTALVYLQFNGIDTERRVATFNLSAIQDPDQANTASFDRTLTVQVIPAIGSGIFTVPAGQSLANEQLKIDLDGDVKLWPFDRYSQPLVVSASSKTGNVSTELKVQLQVEGYSPGWKLANDAKEFDELDKFEQAFLGSVDQNSSLSTITFARSGSILLLSILLVLVMVSLPVMALFVALRVRSGRQKFQPPFTAWFSAMLFAIIPIRSFLPGNPPTGAWVDTAVTVWAVIGLIVALLIYIRAWMLTER